MDITKIAMGSKNLITYISRLKNEININYIDSQSKLHELHKVLIFLICFEGS